MEGASFGAGRAGAALDPVSFARRPQTLLRVASWVSVLHRRLWAHHQRGLRERGQRPGAALCLQRQRRRLPLRGGAWPRGLPRLRRLPLPGRALPADQQRPRPPSGRAAGPGLLRSLGVPVVRGLLLPHQPVAAHGARARRGAGGGRGAGRHRLQLLLHPQLGGAHREGPAAVPPGHRHVALRHRTAGRRAGPGLPRLPGGQRRGGHRDLPEPAFHRDPGHQPQRLPGARLLGGGRWGPGLQSHPAHAGSKGSRAPLGSLLRSPLWALRGREGVASGVPGLSPGLRSRGGGSGAAQGTRAAARSGLPSRAGSPGAHGPLCCQGRGQCPSQGRAWRPLAHLPRPRRGGLLSAAPCLCALRLAGAAKPCQCWDCAPSAGVTRRALGLSLCSPAQAPAPVLLLP